ncbi:MAG: aminotransferase class III-fold pyridoxal phosphate-dependent enzyme [Opitutus sp.]|nr:aminotransferase class III-fold pyridoxal phosphate-dependent enzyme [Opitutus sp.]MCS6248375.1 aminotransferase class III-fold pyridoxal phosphate-dependent enzyme [Opitutus sp.]MCS6274295.1 aminotransferase class III-fold pyridoxal phosphate-dependent enzyme [Opitutus sp.]MCS6278604.1 aminotransferase class III-fold pyridoxal phosphate-dependent enzyme [Opitutus sp.]
MKTPRTLAIIQARTGSTRFPGKVLKELAGGHSLIGFLLSRLASCPALDALVVATTDRPGDNALAEHVAGLGHAVFRGSEADVLDRYYQAARTFSPEIVVRITGDCPLIDPDLVARVVAAAREPGVDYASNICPPTYPDGLDVEAFSFAALEEAWRESKDPYEREHVTPYLGVPGRFKTVNIANDTDESAQRWTVDYPEDYAVVRGVVAHFGGRSDFGWREVLALRAVSPELFSMNQDAIRNEGAALCTGQKLWKRAKRVIPGGNMLLSKRAEMFLPERWPAYFDRSKGCRVWDLDGREFLDMCIMGVGTNTLGYGHPEVDAAVAEVVAKGNMSTLNCPEEVFLAERLVELHPWAGMVRLARTGGEANAVAVRIARAASGRDDVAFCGYHGWHDWYLAANLGSEGALDGHLLPGLQPNGVPRNLAGTMHPFAYNDLAALEQIVARHPVGVIVMEVVRNFGPQDGFLQKVRDLATRKGIVLMFDECTSGFRQTFGGLHKQYGVDPDIAMFGKALGNGYAITAVVGRREVMEHAQDTFISSTFWTERIGPAAALKTLEVMERERSWETITQTGRGILQRWEELGRKHNLPLTTSGLPALACFNFESPLALAYKTLIAQELLDRGILGSNCVYVCTEHTPAVVDRYFEALDPIFGLISECEQGRDVQSLLKVPVCQAGFKRLN